MTEAERGRKAEETKRKGSGKRRSHSQPNKISGDNSWRVPPVPIPNTEVKPPHADGTWLETARESRSSPDSNERTLNRAFVFLYINDGESTLRYLTRLKTSLVEE